MIIRQEESKDYNEIYTLVKEAFATLEHSAGDEADRVNANRTTDYFIPQLSLVAEKDGKILGYISFHKMTIQYTNGRTDTQIEVAPLAVRPDCFKQGIGAMLMEEGCKRAKALGYNAIFLCGHPTYYPRFGYVPTCQYRIYHVLDSQKNAPWCMVKELTPGYLGQEEATIDIE